MSISVSVNEHCQVPPGFRFQPTEEELLLYYLRKRVSCQKIDLDVISDVDLNKFEPWDIQEKCKIGSTTEQSDWYLFSHKDKKYPSGKRTNRATIVGFWKATGRDKVIYDNGGTTSIGLRKTLVFYCGRAPHGHRSDWLMHEYRLITTHEDAIVHKTEEDGWVVCHVFKRKKKNQKTLNSPRSNSSKSMGTESQMLDSYNYEGALEQIFLQPSSSTSCPVDNSSRSISHGGHQPNEAEMVKYIRPLTTTDQVDVAADPSRWPAFDGKNDVASQHDDHTADPGSSQLAVGLNYEPINTNYYCVNRHHNHHPLQLSTVLGSSFMPSSLPSFTSDYILDTNYV